MSSALSARLASSSCMSNAARQLVSANHASQSSLSTSSAAPVLKRRCCNSLRCSHPQPSLASMRSTNTIVAARNSNAGMSSLRHTNNIRYFNTSTLNRSTIAQSQLATRSASSLAPKHRSIPASSASASARNITMLCATLQTRALATRLASIEQSSRIASVSHSAISARRLHSTLASNRAATSSIARKSVSSRQAHSLASVSIQQLQRSFATSTPANEFSAKAESAAQAAAAAAQAQQKQTASSQSASDDAKQSTDESKDEQKGGEESKSEEEPKSEQQTAEEQAKREAEEWKAQYIQRLTRFFVRVGQVLKKLLILGLVSGAVWFSGIVSWTLNKLAHYMCQQLREHPTDPAKVFESSWPWRFLQLLDRTAGTIWSIPIMPVSLSLLRNCIYNDPHIVLDALLNVSGNPACTVEMQLFAVHLLLQFAVDPIASAMSQASAEESGDPNALQQPSLNIELMRAHPGMYDSLFFLATHPNKDIAGSIWMLIRSMLANDPMQEEGVHVIKLGLLPLILRCARATHPDVASAAIECMIPLMPSLPDKEIQKSLGLNDTQTQQLIDQLFGIGVTYCEQQQDAPAVLALQRALAACPKHALVEAPLRIQLAHARIMQGDLEQAVEELRKVMKLEPGNLKAAFQLFRTLKQLGHWDAAQRREVIEVLQSSVSVVGRQVALSRTSGVQTAVDEQAPALSAGYNLLIRTMEDEGMQDDVLHLAQDWTLQCHTDAVAHFHYARLLIRQGHCDEALHALQLALELDPNKGETLYQQALCLYKMSQLNDATSALLKARQLLEQNRVTQVKAARALGVEPQDMSSSSSVDSSSSAAPSTFSLESVLALEFQIERSARQYHKALESVTLYLSLRPQDCGMRLHRGVTLQHLSQQSEAAEEFTRALQCYTRLFTSAPPSPVAAASSSSAQATGKSSKTKTAAVQTPDERRVAYFKSHPAQKAIVDQLGQFCAKQQSSQSAATIDERTRAMCQEWNQLMSSTSSITGKK